jgi:sigma-B regulation protein RsbU (phosphoserine phosphatase)
VEKGKREGVTPAERALHALLDLSKALSSEVDLDSLLSVIVEKASTVVEAERTNIFVFDAARNVLWSRAGHEIVEIPAGQGAVGEVALSLKAANIAFVDAATRSMLAAPIIDSGGDLLGVLQSVNKTTAERFDATDESLILVVASHVAAAMERARLTTAYLEHERLAEALNLASDIQMRMLPHVTPDLQGDAPFELHAFLRPARMVGGDLYDFARRDERLYFCIGDVSGKGIGSALIMALTKTLFRANEPYYEDAARLTEAVNVRLCEETGPTMFVTAFCGFLDLDGGVLHFCNAGHDRPFLLHGDGSVELLESKPGLALGVLPQFKYPLQQMTLEPGDALFLYTDGVTDATNRHEELFALDRLREALKRAAGESALRVIAEVTNAIDRYVERAPQADDVAMMCIRYRGHPMDVSVEVPRQMDALPQVLSIADGLDAKVRLPIELALEEIFTNAVRHNGEGAGPIRVELAVRGGEVVVRITDFDAARFDIQTDAPAVDIDQPLENRTPGGLGIHLVKKMMDRIEYSHRNRTATITLHKRC